MTGGRTPEGGPAGRPVRRLARRLVRREGVLFRALEGESILLDPESGTYYALNEVGARIWELAADRPTLEEILRTLAAEYEVEDRVLSRDLDRLVRRLVDEGLADLHADD